ncbi:hypothetical protein ACA081_00405 [Candidatus Hodgkinia cicadicola]
MNVQIVNGKEKIISNKLLRCIECNGIGIIRKTRDLLFMKYTCFLCKGSGLSNKKHVINVILKEE